MAARACAVWCSHHDRETGICYAEPIDLEFAPDPEIRAAAGGASVDLARAGDGTTVIVAAGGTPAVPLTLDAAERYAYAILAQAALARGLTSIATRNLKLATAPEYVMGVSAAPGAQDTPSGAQNARQDAPARHDTTVWVPAPRGAVQGEQSEVPR